MNEIDTPDTPDTPDTETHQIRVRVDTNIHTSNQQRPVKKVSIMKAEIRVTFVEEEYAETQEECKNL